MRTLLGPLSLRSHSPMNAALLFRASPQELYFRSTVEHAMVAKSDSDGPPIALRSPHKQMMKIPATAKISIGRRSHGWQPTSGHCGQYPKFGRIVNGYVVTL